MNIRRDRTRTSVSRGPVQLLGGLAAAVALPWLLRYAAGGYEDAIHYVGARNDLIGSAAALLLGNYFVQRLVSYPGARASSYILPVFAASYGAVLTAFFFFRLDYGRFQFVASFVIAIGWYYVSSFAFQRMRRRRLAVVPEGKAIELASIPSVEWRWMGSPQASFLACDGLVADFRADLSPEWERLIADKALAGVPVYHVKQIQESITGRVDIEHLSENNFGSLIPGLAYIKLKQLIDVAAALVAAVVLLPVLLAIGIAVKLDSRGPMMFRQARIGYRGRPFRVAKFRTMHPVDPAHRDDARTQAMTQAGDDRITRLGRFLRRTRLDELPQILNIVRGEMSWIGPRPEAVVLSDWYEAELPFYRYRHIVRPGITGWAQVNQGHVTELGAVGDKLQYDFYYIKYFSPWLDILIVMRTMKIMVTGFGSK